MEKITQYSRISHHTISGPSASGLTFSIPPSEDFTDGTWTIYDLSYSEIGVNETDKKAYIRIDDEVKEFQFTGGGGGGGDLSTTLGLGNTTGAHDIIIEQNITDTTGNTYLTLNASSGKIENNDLLNNTIHRVHVDNTQVLLSANDGAETSSISLDSQGKRIHILTPDYDTPGYNGHILMGGYSDAMNVISFGTVNTSDDTPTPLHTIKMGIKGPKSYKVRVVGSSDDNQYVYLAELFGLYLFDGNDNYLIGTLDKVEKTNFTGGATSTIDISGDVLIVTVTGESSTDITWTAYVQTNNFE